MLFRFVPALTLLALVLPAVAAPSFDAGSDGSYGSLIVPANTSLEVPLPDDGVIHATEVSIEAGGVLSFTRNVNNTPVYLLSQGDIDIQGTIDVSGQSPPGASGGAGGPGGFDGGRAGSQPGNRPNSVDYVYTMLHLVGGRGGPGNGSVRPGRTTRARRTCGRCRR